MIKNMVFDMGKVLINYDASRCSRYFMEDEEERKAVETSVFTSPEWLLLDMGVISEEEALKKMQSRLDTAHAKEMAKQCLDHWDEHCMWPFEGMADVLKALKEKGYKLYICSNASVRLLTCFQEAIPGIEYFDGVLFSAEVKCIKPQKEMYHHLFDRFQLKPEECFFIDDLQLNIDGGKACGMDGYCFADGDVGALRRKLGI